MFKHIIFFLTVFFLFAGCETGKGNTGRFQGYSFPNVEPDWIREGNPIEFENDLWFPVDGVEVFTDSEMMLMGQYKDVEFFVDKIDVRPFERIYTKFDKNKFRYFERKE